MTEPAARSILLVEDDAVTATIIAGYLKQQGFTVEHETRGDAAVEKILAMQPDVVVLDGMLPGKDGFEICRELRPNYRGLVLMLTSRSEDLDQVLGLELGADDYITKPVEPRVLLARIRAALRRVGPGAAATDRSDELRFGRFCISRATRSVRLGDEELSFTTAEFDLLWLLASHAGAVLSRDDIHSNLRGIEHDGLDRSIDMRISRLRKRLGDDAGSPTRIKTVRGKGYLFSRSDWD